MELYRTVWTKFLLLGKPLPLDLVRDGPDSYYC